MRQKLIDFYDRAQGLVETFWRGQYDFHGTLSSMDDDGFTRFGTSIQITGKGVNAMHKVWNVAELAASGHDVRNLARKSRVTTAQDRYDSAMVRIPPISCSAALTIMHLGCAVYVEEAQGRK